MKTIIDANMGSGATDATRDLSSLLTIQKSFSLAPDIDISYSRRQLLDVLQDIAAYSWKNGTYLTFDIVYTGPGTLEFRTYVGQRGVDHGKDLSIG